LCEVSNSIQKHYCLLIREQELPGRLDPCPAR
jgi:hypothetical protein